MKMLKIALSFVLCTAMLGSLAAAKKGKQTKKKTPYCWVDYTGKAYCDLGKQCKGGICVPYAKTCTSKDDCKEGYQCKKKHCLKQMSPMKPVTPPMKPVTPPMKPVQPAEEPVMPEMEPLSPAMENI